MEPRQTLYSTSENKNDGIRVDLGNRRKDDLLTEALYNPHLLTNEPAFILKHDNLVLQRKDEVRSLAGQQVLLIDTLGDRVKMALLLLLFLILSPALGIIVGRLAERADVGVAVSAGIFALASFLQGLAAWLHG